MYGTGDENIGGGRRDETARYQGIGAAAAKRQAYQADFGRAMGDEAQGLQSRDAQVAGLNNMRNAAMGNAPSQAAILGGQAAGQSLQAQMQAGAGARGMGQAAAQMQAAQGVGQQQLAGVGQFTGMRGNEMAHAQGAYGQASGSMRAGDYTQQGMAQQRAEAQAASENAQRAMNQQAQLHYEQMGVRNNQAQSEAELRHMGIASKENEINDKRQDQEQSRLGKWAKAGVSALGTAASFFSDESTKRDVVPLYEEPGTEQHYDRDVSKAKPDAVSGASLSGPTPKYSHAQPAAKPQGMAHAAKHRLSDAELQRMADEMLGTQKAQHAAALAVGPSVGHRDAPERGSRADLLSGPSKWEIEWNRSHGNKSGSGMSDEQDDENNPQPYDDEHVEAMNMPRPGMSYSDDRTKLVAAQREAFTAGLAHANAAQETGKFPTPPAYVQEGSTSARRQPPAAEHKAATPHARGDRDTQNAVNEASQRNYDGADAAAALAVPLGYGASLGALGATRREDTYQGDRRQPPPAAAPAPEDGRSLGSYASQMRAMVSDKRAKQDAHAEKDMGVALEQGFKPFEYEYKPGFREQEGQRPGEKNVGPMAQNMASNSITGSAVEQGPDGLLRIDLPKVTKTNSAGIGYLAAKQRKMEEEIARLKGGR